jgi:hypothetical protein
MIVIILYIFREHNFYSGSKTCETGSQLSFDIKFKQFLKNGAWIKSSLVEYPCTVF